MLILSILAVPALMLFIGVCTMIYVAIAMRSNTIDMNEEDER